MTTKPRLDTGLRKHAASRGRIVFAAGERALADPFAPTAQDVQKINQLTLREHAADELWVVTILAADNQRNRHDERLQIPALRQLAPTFVGRPGIVDHRWSAKEQNARIFDAWVETDDSVESHVKGERYTALYFKVYMLRTEATAAMRQDIEGGIRKETSIGFLVDWMAVVCSVCGGAIYDWMGKCCHWPGEDYEGVLCLGEIPAHDGLEGVENSWVAVPAEPRAGAVKTDYDAEADGIRRECLAKKEAALERKDLMALLADPAKLALALDGEDQAVVAQFVARLSVGPATPAPAAQAAQASAEQSVGDAAQTTGEQPVVAPEVATQAAPPAAAEPAPAGQATLAADTPTPVEPVALTADHVQAAVQAAVDLTAKAVMDTALAAFKAEIDGITTALKADVEAVKATLASKLAPVGDGPLATGFGDTQPAAGAPGQHGQALGVPQDSVASAVAGALLAR